MKKTILMILMAAMVTLAGCQGVDDGNEPLLPTDDVIAVDTPLATINDPVSTTVPEGPFDRQYSGYWSQSGGWFVGSSDIEGTNNCNNDLYFTDDGGLTWTEAGNLNDRYTLPVTCALFIDESVGFLGFHYDLEYTGPVYRTEDGGNSWTELQVESISQVKDGHWQREPRQMRYEDGILEITYFVSTSYYGETGLLYTTTSSDMGDTWSDCVLAGEQEGSVPPGDFDRQFPYFHTPQSGWFVGSKDVEGTVMCDNYLYKTSDAGETWTELVAPNAGLPVTCIFFDGDNLGFLGFRGDFEETGKVFRTDDGAETWTDIELPTLRDIPGFNWRCEATEIRNLGDTLMLTYFFPTSENGDAGQSYFAYSDDWGLTWGAFEPVREEE